jgi:hypothetical protein
MQTLVIISMENTTNPGWGLIDLVTKASSYPCHTNGMKVAKLIAAAVLYIVSFCCLVSIT